MKQLFPVIVVVAVSGTGFGQNVPVPGAPGIYNGGALKPSNQPHVFAGPEEFRLEIVRRLMLGPTSRPTTGSVQLHRMGDEAAVDIVKILGGGTSLSAAGALTVLDIVHTAFEHPLSIASPSDQHPNATLFLLHWMDTSTQDRELKGHIGEAIQCVQEAAKTTAGSAP